MNTSPTVNNARPSWSISLDTLQQNLAHTTPEYRESLIWAFGWSLKNNIFLSDFAAAVNYDPSVITRILKGSYKDPRSGELYDIPKRLHDEIQSWKHSQLSTYQPTTSTAFVITPTVKRIWLACDLARESQTPVFLYGGSQLGKTTALQNYTDTHLGTTRLVRVPTAAGLRGLVIEISKSLGIPTSGSTTHLIERIKLAITKDTLLIFDEVHQLIYTYRKDAFFSCLEVIRSIFDHTRCSMLFCTTNVFRDRFQNAQKSELEQLFKRTVHQYQIGNIVLVKDLREIITNAGLSMPKQGEKITINGNTQRPYEILKSLSNDSGLTSITERIRYALKLAHAKTQAVTWADFCAAHIIIGNNAQAPESDWED